MGLRIVVWLLLGLYLRPRGYWWAIVCILLPWCLLGRSNRVMLVCMLLVGCLRFRTRKCVDPPLISLYFQSFLFVLVLIMSVHKVSTDNELQTS